MAARSRCRPGSATRSGARARRSFALGPLAAGGHTLAADVRLSRNATRLPPGRGAFAAMLKLRHADGRVSRFTSGPGWRTALDPAEDWMHPGFDDAAWAAARPASHRSGPAHAADPRPAAPPRLRPGQASGQRAPLHHRARRLRGVRQRRAGGRRAARARKHRLPQARALSRARRHRPLAPRPEHDRRARWRRLVRERGRARRTLRLRAAAAPPSGPARDRLCGRLDDDGRHGCRLAHRRLAGAGVGDLRRRGPRRAGRSARLEPPRLRRLGVAGRAARPRRRPARWSRRPRRRSGR